MTLWSTARASLSLKASGRVERPGLAVPSVVQDRARRRSDGRRAAHPSGHTLDAGCHQPRAGDAVADVDIAPVVQRTPDLLPLEQVTMLSHAQMHLPDSPHRALPHGYRMFATQVCEAGPKGPRDRGPRTLRLVAAAASPSCPAQRQARL